jgi:hypothetical protein
MIQLIWFVDPAGMFETDWLNDMFADIQHEHIIAADIDDIQENLTAPIFIFNASIPYEKFLCEFDEERVPFGVIHLSDETLGNTCDYLELSSCVFAIRNYHHPLYSLHPKVLTIGLGYKSGYKSITPQKRSKDPWFHWCFVGAVHHVSRRESILAFQNVKPGFISLSSGGFNSKNLTLEQYKNVMVISKFALCPLGQGNLDTFRLYEAMEAGCVPIVLASTSQQPYVPSYWHFLFGLPASFEIPFIIGTDWNECVQKVETLLQNPYMYYELQTKMIRFWEGIKTHWRNRINNLVSSKLISCSP